MSQVFNGKSLRDPSTLKAGTRPVAHVNTPDETLAHRFGDALPTFEVEFPGTRYAVLYEIADDGVTILDLADVGV